MIREIEQLADQILALDEDELVKYVPYYKRMMEDFTPSPEWERSVIAFFLISAVRVKNTLLKGHLLKQNFYQCNNRDCPLQPTPLRVVK